jgi:hypothetical protein
MLNAHEPRPSKPSYRFVGSLPTALQLLASKRQWVCWDYVWNADKGKWDKPPLSAHTGRLAKGGINNPAALGAFSEAAATAAKHGLAGVGYVISHDDDITGIDLDDCITDSGCFSDLATEIVGYAETYAEISPSGAGIRLFVRGKIGRAIKNDAAGVEAYAAGRYLTVTGNKLEDAPDAINEAPRTLARILAFAKREKHKANGANGGAHASGADFWANVNTAALAHLDSWVPELHPTARKQATGAWRVTSNDLGRGLDEDLSYHPDGIRDHGEEVGLTPIDAVQRYGTAGGGTDAAIWLCQRMCLEPASLGWKRKQADGAKFNGTRKRRSTGSTVDADESLIAELAALSPLEYARRRKEAAARIGLPLAMLDQLVKEMRKCEGAVSAEPLHWDVDPWPELVNGDKLLRDLSNVFRAHAVLPAHADVVLALWCVHTWCLDCTSRSPFLTLVSAVKRSGKTTVMSLLKWLTYRSELVSNISSAALFRYIEAYRPTLLMDEGDSFLPDDEAMRGILNSGHTRSGAYVIRCDGEQLTPRRFSTWAAKAIAPIAKVADTLVDRSIVIDMVRKRTTEPIRRWDLDDTKQLVDLRRQVARWAEENYDALKAVEPDQPPGLNDRASDNWRPLLAIAQVAGAGWLEVATKAAVALSGSREDDDILVRLLADIREIFGRNPLPGSDDDYFTPTALAAELAKIEDAPWPEWRGKPITPTGVTRLLKRLGIKPDRSRGGGKYFRRQFEDAWQRLLPNG